MKTACLLLLGLLPNALGADRGPTDTLPRPPRLHPDYADITLPPNIAPLNFAIEEPGTRYEVTISSHAGPPIELSSRTGEVIIPMSRWRTLLQQNRGRPLVFDFRVESKAGQWQRFAAITNTISEDELDAYLAYRLLNSQFSMFSSGTMGIYQRNLETYDQSPILELKDRTGQTPGCLNCHTFLNRRPDTLTLHLRSPVYGKPMLLIRNGEVKKVDKTGGYMTWHPSGKLIVFSLNSLSLFFHSAGETRDVFDANSDLAVYHLDSNTVTAPAAIAQPDQQETWPSWAPDGRYLYFCRAPRTPREQFRSIRYDLMRVSFDLATDAWGTPERVMSAQEAGRSLAQPKVSPDGRFVMVTTCEYGSFPIYQPNSDLYLLELATHQFRRLELNCDQADSWHSWSSNGRWVVFSSKRLTHMLSRPFFSHIDAHGATTKPFVLPQKDPRFYDSFLKTFNVPELITGPVPINRRVLFDAVARTDNLIKPRVLTQTRQPEQQNEAGPVQGSAAH